MLGFDYDNQAWVRDGRYVDCGHLDECSCYGTLHVDELATVEVMDTIARQQAEAAALPQA
jgi:Ser-tRNA(Ala) deacylase AlaX